MVVHFLARAKKTEPKEGARVPLNPARRRPGWSTRKLARRRRTQTVRALFPSASAMLGAEQMGEKPIRTGDLILEARIRQRRVSLIWIVVYLNGNSN